MNLSKRQEIMLAHAEKLVQSGLTVKKYAEINGINLYSMEYWVRRKRELEQKIQEEAPTFIQVKDQDHQPINNRFISQGDPQVVLRFANGLCLEIYS